MSGSLPPEAAEQPTVPCHLLNASRLLLLRLPLVTRQRARGVARNPGPQRTRMVARKMARKMARRLDRNTVVARTILGVRSHISVA